MTTEPKPENHGAACPKCWCRHCPALYTRRQRKFTIRKRECRNCGYRFTTSEKTQGEAV